MLNNLNKKGAMFGLDARIALAIFGALSVISGAALYSAIQQAKATALLTDLREIGKAWEAYYLDTGEELPRANSDSSSGFFNRMNIHRLLENNNIKGWNGPYLNYPIRTSNLADYSLVHNNYGNVYMFSLNGDNDWGDASPLNDGYCEVGDDCYIWAYISGINNLNLNKRVDEIIDGGDGPLYGNLRWTNSAANIIYKVAPIKNPLG
jgi:type II secretory pathway pseudopilin PulG